MIKKTHRFLNDFKAFAVKGNVIDLAVGVIIGGAFGKITTSLVNDLIMPLVSLITGSHDDFSSLFIALDGQTYAARADVPAEVGVFAYGNFLVTVLDFLIIAFIVFLMVRSISKLRAKEKAPEVPAPPTTKTCPYCQLTIAIAAVRCPHCTSELTLEAATE